MDKIIYSKIKKITLVSKKLAEGVFAGSYRSAFKGPGLEFDEVREYVDGDDARNIDWNVTSRLGQAYSKKFREERELNFYFIVDVSGSAALSINEVSRKDMAAQILSLLANAAMINNDRVGAIFFSDIIEKWLPATRGRNQTIRIINDMMKLEPKSKGTDLGLAISSAYKNMKHKGVCVIISDFKYQDGWKELTLLSKKHDIICIRISDESDEIINLKGLVEFRDVETGKNLKIFNPSFSGVNKRYNNYWKDQFYFWEELFFRRKIRYIKIKTDEDPVAKLLEYFDKDN